MADSLYAFFPLASVPSLDPAGLDVVRLDQDPVLGEVSIEEPASRGAVIPTLAGAVVQTFAPCPGDGRITIKDARVPGKALTIAALNALAASGQAMRFTDGAGCWQVRFVPGARPARPDQYFAARRVLGLDPPTAPVVYDLDLALVIEGRDL